MTFAKILATGSYLPEKVLTNHDLAKIIDTSDEWVVDRTGIKQRHIIAEHETTSSMAEIATHRTLEQAGMTANDIELIIVATCTPDRIFPSTACILQQRLGIKRTIPAFDVSAACAGFVYALSVAELFIKQGTVKNALVVGSECLSRVTDWSDRKTCILFGDGAGCVLLQASDEPGIHACELHADGDYKDILYLPNDIAAPNLKTDSPYIIMHGNDVFKLAVTELGACAESLLNKHNLTADDIDWLVPHQANLRIIKSVAKRIGLPMEKVVLSVESHGNTSSASIPLALDAAIRDGRVQRGHRLLLEAIGGGMTWGSLFVTY